MKTTALSTLAAGLLFGGTLFANSLPFGGEECSAAQKAECSTLAECPTAQKVDALLVSWEEASQKAEAATPEARQAMGAEMASVAGQCPVGSRMTGVLSGVRDVLGMVVASSEANAENCPLEKGELDADVCAEGKALKAARTEVIGKLHQLASYASGADECAAKAAAAGCEASAEECASAKEACCATEVACEEKSKSCPITMASRLGALKASMATARREASELTAERRGEILAGFGSLSEKHPAVGLMPASVTALAEGFGVLEELDAKMGAWAQANPEVLAGLPESAHQTYMMESALLKEAHGVLTGLTEAMQMMQSTTAPKTAMAVDSNNG